jgi:hypothetical protein
MTYSLYEELEHESRRRQTSELVREDPGRDQTCRYKCSDAHRAPTADPLGEVTDDSSANASTSLHQDACC